MKRVAEQESKIMVMGMGGGGLNQTRRGEARACKLRPTVWLDAMTLPTAVTDNVSQSKLPEALDAMYGLV